MPPWSRCLVPDSQHFRQLEKPPLNAAQDDGSQISARFPWCQDLQRSLVTSPAVVSRPPQGRSLGPGAKGLRLGMFLWSHSGRGQFQCHWVRMITKRGRGPWPNPMASARRIAVLPGLHRPEFLWPGVDAMANTNKHTNLPKAQSSSGGSPSAHFLRRQRRHRWWGAVLGVAWTGLEKDRRKPLLFL